MLQPNSQNQTKDCLKDRFIDANLVTQISLERDRLNFLKNCIYYKRPPQSLRVRGLKGLAEEKSRLLVQEIELKALLSAIEEKEMLVRELEERLKEESCEAAVDVSFVILNKKKLDKKLLFYQQCEDSKWKEWKKRSLLRIDVSITKKARRKMHSKLRKLKKKEESLMKAAHYALENNLVRNLSGVEVPLFSIGVLSYGPGWIPLPSFDGHKFKIDASNAANKQAWSAKFKDAQNTEKEVPLSLLKNVVTSPAPFSKDFVVNQAKEDIINFASNCVPKKCNSNLNRFEREGLRWLTSAVKSRKIAITQADKGGCILIVKPKLILSSTEKKLKETDRYCNLGDKNPLPELKSLMMTLWKFAVTADYVTDYQAKKTVGLINKFDVNVKDPDPFTYSTLDKFKPGIPYPYPLFKIHKLSLAELENPDVQPPIRLVTDLHDGVSSRSDKFIVWKWLAPLCQDYAIDLVKDSSATLLKLEEMGSKGDMSDSTLAFGIDVVSLYDSIKFDLVRSALNDAMESCRPEWDDDFRKWLVDITLFSFESAVVKFQGRWYGVKEGVPTGGVPSVSVANMCVFFVFKKLIYEQENSCLVDLLRFVDDGLGFFSGDIDNFYSWFNDVRETSVDLYGLDLTVCVNPVTSFTQFLDIQFKFNNGKLTTDIFRKPTDANRYLYFNSYHPRHTFRSIVYSQGMRYRRIINDNVILEKRLDELKVYFMNSGYPARLVNSILDSIPKKPRCLEYAVNQADKKIITPWVVTYGPGYDEAKNMEKNINELLSLSDTWKDADVQNVVKVIPRKGANLKSLLFRRKNLALCSLDSGGIVSSKKCGSRCQTCALISNTEFLYHNGCAMKTVGGDCKSWNVVYCFQCKICNIKYVGKTVDPLHERMNGHRHNYYDVLRQSDTVRAGKEYDDEQILGAHLANEHNFRRRTDFNENYKVYIMAHCSPISLRPTEQFWINKLRTLRPYGLNQNNSVG